MELRFAINVDDKGNPAITMLGRNAQTTGTHVTKLGSIFGSVFGAGMLLGLLNKASQAVRSFAGEFVKVADIGDGFAKMSQRVGMSVESLSKLDYVAKLSGTSMEGIEKSLQKASKAIYTASGSAKDNVFDRLGISIKNNKGQLIGTDALILQLSDKFSKMSDNTTKAAMATEIFGKSGTNMLPILNQGTAAIKAEMEEAQKLGIAWTSKGAVAAARFHDTLTTLKMSFEGIKRSTILPILEKMTPVLEILAGNMDIVGKVLKIVGQSFKNTFIGKNLTQIEATEAIVRGVALAFEIMAKSMVVAFAAGRIVWNVFTAISGILATISMGALAAGTALLSVFKPSMHDAAVKFWESTQTLAKGVITDVGDIGTAFIEAKDAWNTISGAMKPLSIKNSIKTHATTSTTEEDFQPEPANRMDALKQRLKLEQDCRDEGRAKEIKDLENQTREEKREALKNGVSLVLVKEAFEKKKWEINKKYALKTLDDTVQNLQTCAQAMKGFGPIYKAAAFAQNAIATYTGASEAFKSMAGIPVVGPALGIAAAAAAIIAGGVRGAAIMATKFKSGTIFGNGGSSTDNIPALYSPGEEVLSGRDVKRLGGRSRIEAAINEGGAAGGHTFIFNNPIGEKRFFEDWAIPAIKHAMARV